jgi:hypothetical protein
VGRGVREAPLVDLDRNWGRRGARRQGSAAPPRADRRSPNSGKVGVMPATWGGWWARVGAKEGGGELALVCSRPGLELAAAAINGAGGGSAVAWHRMRRAATFL